MTESPAVIYPDVDTDWVDSKDPGRSLHVREVEPGDGLGREIRGTVTDPHWGERDYATDHRTFCGAWRPA